MVWWMDFAVDFYGRFSWADATNQYQVPRTKTKNQNQYHDPILDQRWRLSVMLVSIHRNRKQ
jgi:hypothetical protein